MSGNFGDRLSRALEASGKTRAELAKVLRSSKGTMGISVSAIGQAINGLSKAFNAENTVRAARFLNVNALWLAADEGPMRPREEGALRLVAAEPAPTPYPTDSAVLEQFALLLARVPRPMRAAFSDVLAGWAADGGTPDRTPALLALLASPGKQAS